ncbi:MAG: hypothetical protein ABS23_08680 [SAR92 bacterium BACL16 MAG-120619-bin48]|jgi:arylsulfatase A-like enzyme|nr:MAG: hypothetical protein ABS23_08680 [SAR92 bacterium BACL16 MAG-120619-bin48]
MRMRQCLFVITLMLLPLVQFATADTVIADQRPNILIVVADDLGFSDIEPYGGEIATPTLARLADNGLKLTNFHSHTVCTPTRAMLLSGVNNHAVGIAAMAGEARGAQQGAPGYEGYLRHDVLTLADLLSASGYQSWMSGKWDLGGRNDDSLLPNQRGFDRSFALVEGSADFFRVYPALAELPDVNYRLDGKKHPPTEPFYITDVYTDYALEFIQELDEEKPFFGYLTYTAPHYPLQAPDSFIRQYDGVYEVGYATIREARLKGMVSQGVIENPKASPPTPLWPSWSELSATQQAFEARRMAVYAAMITAMDAQLSRVIKVLEDSGRLDNTLIVFLSDNGPEGGNPLDWADFYTDWAISNFDLSLANLGRPHSYAWTGPRWAEVSATPFALFKGFASEGGTRVPAIIHWPAGLERVGVSDEYLHVLDVPATLLDIAGVPHSGTETTGHKARKLEGRVLTPFLASRQSTVDDTVHVWEIFDRRAVRAGKWKMTYANARWGKGDGWSLYDLEADPTEVTDVILQYPEVAARLLQEWEHYVEANHLILLEGGLNLRWTNLFTHFDWAPVPPGASSPSESEDEKE